MHIGGAVRNLWGWLGALRAFSSYILLLVHPQTWMCPRFFLELFCFLSLPHSHGRLGSIIVFLLLRGCRGVASGGPLDGFSSFTVSTLVEPLMGNFLQRLAARIFAEVFLGRRITQEATLPPPHYRTNHQKKRLFVLLDFSTLMHSAHTPRSLLAASTGVLVDRNFNWGLSSFLWFPQSLSLSKAPLRKSSDL